MTVASPSREPEHEEDSVWQHFDAATREALLEEDHVAWRGVCGLLISIVSMGLVIAVTAVLLSAL